MVCETHHTHSTLLLHADDSPFIKSRLKKALMFTSRPSPPAARAYLKEMAGKNGFIIDESTASDYTTANLSQYQLALFISDYNINFNNAQKADFEKWFGQGNGAVCIHACSRYEIQRDWPPARSVKNP